MIHFRPPTAVLAGRSRPSLPVTAAEPRNAQWQAINRVRNKQELAMRDAFMRVMGEWGNELNLTQLARHVFERNMFALLRALPVNILEEEVTNASYDILRETMRLAGESQIAFIPGMAEATAAFDMLNLRAVDWIASHTAELVTRVSDDVQLTIRYITQRSFTDGIPPTAAAKYIKQTVGLLPRHAGAVYNYRQKLLSDGMSAPHADVHARAYADRLLTHRANMIARTETNFASANGQQELWLQAAENGYINPAKVVRLWLVTHDDRLSQNRCKPMTGQTRPLTQPFLTGEGSLVMTPPAGVMCRCGMALKFLE